MFRRNTNRGVDTKNFLKTIAISDGVDDIGKKLKVRYNDDLDGYKFTNDYTKLEKGMVIKYIDLNIETINCGVVTIVCKKNSTVYKIGLKTVYNKKIWYINPSQYYIYYKNGGVPKGTARDKPIISMEKLTAKYGITQEDIDNCNIYETPSVVMDDKKNIYKPKNK